MNPQKQDKPLDLDCHHRIIVVVYVPESDSAFYKHSFEVFKASLTSIKTSINEKAKITIVNNGSNTEVTSYLNECYALKVIDTLINHSTNIGKIDALIGAARGAREPLLTLADSDILFKKGWQEAVEEVFLNFKDVGSVSPISVRASELYCTSATLKRIWLKRLKFRYEAIPENFDDYNKYMDSINWDHETDTQLKWPVVEANAVKALVGSGHQVLTINRQVLFETVPFEPSLILVGNHSEYKYVDEPIDKSGRLRLSTYHNYAYHMGNTVEDWMTAILEDNQTKSVAPIMDFNESLLKKTSFLKSIKRKWYTGKRLLYKTVFLTFYKR